jgi:outer membrane protein insertion porin family
LACCALISPAARSQDAPGPADAQTDLDGRNVAEIQITDAAGNILPDKLPLMPLQTGKPFDLEAERSSLRALYATGRYDRIETRAIGTSTGLRIDFIVQRTLYNNVVRVEGLKEPPSEASALSAIRMPLGEPFRPTALTDGIARLSTTLQDEGLYQAHLHQQLYPHPATQQMDITVTITPGRRARIGQVGVSNQSRLTDAELLKRSHLKTKQELTSSRITHAVDRLRKSLIREGYLGATVSAQRGPYDAAANNVAITLQVIGGPRVRVNVEGEHYSPGKIRKLLPIYAEGGVDEDLLQEGSRNIRDDLQRQGYFDSQVDYTSAEDTARNERVITYNVTRSARHRLSAITFTGNKYFSNSLLRGRLQLQTASFASRGRFSQRILRDDADSIRGVYLANGFLQADVKSDLLDNYRGKTGDLEVRFQIVEGTQTRVASLSIEGNQALSDKDLANVVGSTPGQPYSESDVGDDRNNILALYFNDGYPDAQVTAEATPAEQPDRVNLLLKVTEGRRIDISRVLITGYEHTRYGIIAREVKIKSGQPLRESEVLETQRRLYNLAIFNRVQIAPQNPDGTDPDKVEVVDVEEGKRWTFGYGGGIEVQELPGSGSNPTGTSLNASPRVIFELGKADIAGRAQSISFKVRASTLQYRAVLSYTAPHILTNPHYNLQLTGYADKTQDVNTFNSERYEGAIQLVDTISTSSSVLYRYFFRHVLVDAASLKIAPEEIPLFSQPTRVSGLGVSWFRDRRNNAADATKGTYNTVDVSIALRDLGSSAGFFRGYFQNSSFHPFGKSLVFARAVRFGVEETLPGTTDDEIPLPERFFAGGGQSLRGFGLNQAGPRDPVTGFPVGGLALLEFNQELRFPMKLPVVGNKLGGTLFYDAGNVYSDLEHITWRYTPSSLTNLNYLSHTVGAGFRYGTPIGPVRLDFGYQLNPAQFQFQNTTTNQLDIDRLPHFQFFFNIGPVF